MRDPATRADPVRWNCTHTIFASSENRPCGRRATFAAGRLEHMFDLPRCDEHLITLLSTATVPFRVVRIDLAEAVFGGGWLHPGDPGYPYEEVEAGA